MTTMDIKLVEGETCGAYSTLLTELPLEDDQEARRYLRMSYKSFQVLLANFRPLIEKKGTFFSYFVLVSNAGERS